MIELAGLIAGGLRLDRGRLAQCSDEEVEEALLPLIRSNHYRLLRNQGLMLLDGPDTSYHDIDPHFSVALAAMGVGREQADRQAYRRHGPPFDLCLEDSWCGLFLAQYLAKLAPGDGLTIIHLDDHGDMMSTLLHAGSPLPKAVTAHRFDPADPQDWPAAIASGAVGIGSFLTPFFALDRRVSILHLKADAGAAEDRSVLPTTAAHPLLCDRFFAVTLEQKLPSTSTLHTYRRGQDPVELLNEVPAGPLAVHIDLDYFINDFNGNADQSRLIDPAEGQEIAVRRLDCVFTALAPFKERIGRWMVGTSPGFCSAIHWPFLLTELERRIAILGSGCSALGGGWN